MAGAADEVLMAEIQEYKVSFNCLSDLIWVDCPSVLTIVACPFSIHTGTDHAICLLKLTPNSKHIK